MANKSAFLESVLNGTYENKKTDWGKQKITLPTPKTKTFTERLKSTGKEALQDITSYVKKRTDIKKRTESYVDKNLKTKTNKEQTNGGSTGSRMTVNTLDELYNAKSGLEKQIEKAPTEDKKGLLSIYSQVNKDIKAKEAQGEKKTPFLKKIAKTAVSAGTLLGKGIVKGAEGILDTAVNIGTSKYNPYYLFGNNADRLERDQQMAQEFIQKDSTQELMNMVGYDDKLSTGKTIQQTLDEASMLKSGTKEASIVEGVGQNVLSAFLGSELASGVPISSASKFATKATTVAREIVETLPFAATSYGSSLEEAYNSGADRKLANEYAVLNTALELGTEKIYSSVGSVLRTGGAIDDVFTKKITSKISNSLFKKMAEIGLGAVAEGGEEVVGALINPILKKLTYLNDTDLKTLYENANILDAFVGGAIGGAVLGTASVAINDKTDLTNQSIKELNNIVKTSKNEKEVKLATKIIENTQFNNNIKSVTDEKQQITTPEAIKPSVEQQTIPSEVNIPQTQKTQPQNDMLDISKVLTNKQKWSDNFNKTEGYQYLINGNAKNGNVIITKSKDGFIFNNINLNDNLQGKGLGTNILKYLNQQSIKETGKPLQSLPEYSIVGLKNHTEAGKALWESVVRKGLAIKNTDNSYSMLKTPNGQLLKTYFTNNEIKELGYDGIIAKVTTGFGENEINAYEYGVFDNNQIKLVESNKQPIQETTIQQSETSHSNITPQVTTQKSITPVEEKTLGLTKEEQLELDNLKEIDNVFGLNGKEQVRYNFLINKQEQQSRIEKLKIEKRQKLVKKYAKQIDSGIKNITKKLNGVLYFNDTNQKNKFKTMLNEYVQNKKNASFENIKQDIENNFSEKIIKTTDETLKNIKRDIRSYTIKVDDYLKKSITDYNQFRKSNFGKLNLSNNGQNIGSIYDELSEQYPYIFGVDVINEVDQLNKLSEFMGEDITTVDKYNLTEDMINESVAYIKAFIDSKQPIDELLNSISISSSEVRKQSIKDYRYLAQKYTEQMANWKDTPILKQRTQTMKRNLRDIVGEQSEAMYDEYFAPISKHNAELTRFINNYNERVKEIGLNNNEAIATQMIGELKYNPDTQLTQENVDQFLSGKNIDLNKVNGAVETLRNIYDELIVNINDTLKQFGLKEIDYRKGYFPHFIDQHGKTVIGKIMEKLGWKFNDNKIPTDIAGITDMFSPNKKWTSFAQRRTGDLTDYNALKGFDNYIRGAAHLIYHTEDIQKLNGLQNEIRYQHSDKGLQKDIDTIENNTTLTEEEKQSAIDSRYQNYDGDLANFVVNLKDYTDNLAGKKSSIDRGAESLAGRKIYNTIDNIMNRASGNMVGANIGSALTNFIPLTQAYSQISTVNMLKAVAQTISNQKNNDNFDAKSTYLSNRVNEADKLFKTGIEKASDISSFMFKGIDNAVSEIIVRGKYLENIKKGMDETKALNNADEFAKDVMAGRSLGDKPTIFNSKTNKLLTAFQLEVNNQYQYMFKDLPHDMQNEAKGKLLLAFLKMFVGAWVYNQLSEKITGRKPAFSPIDIIQETTDTVLNDNLSVYEKLAKTGKNLADELPFIGGLLGGGRIPISSAFPDVATTIEATSNLLDSSKSENVKKTSRANLAKELSKPLYYLIPPFGGGQTKKTIEGLSMFSKKNNVAGSYTASGKLRFPVNENIVSKAQAALFGQYSSENAKEYFNNNYSPLGEKQVQEYKDLNVDIKDYWKYREGLSKQKSIDEKFNYISNTDFTNKQKNILINNAVDRKEKVDISNYKDYQSYDEFSYATSNPSDYAISKQIASYDKFKDWSDKIAFRRETSDEDKKVTIKYINSLPLTVAQKALFIKKYYSSYDSYNDEIVKYINSKNISKFEKATILKGIGFNNYDDYLIKYVDAEKLTKDEKLNKLKEMGFTIKNGKVYK